MAVICPTVTAYSMHEYADQLRLITEFADRVHIDLMDGTFAPTISPELGDIRLPHNAIVDIHLMYQEPMTVLSELIHLKPSLVVIHNEAHVHHMHFVAELHKHGIKAGLALLADTPVEYAHQIMHSFDHVLVFSGDLGHHGGTANLELLHKVREIHDHHPDVEIGWDGGVNESNAATLAAAGVDVLNTGGAIHGAADPLMSYKKLTSLVNQ